MTMQGYTYTKHAVQRFTQRFPHLVEKGTAPIVCLHRAFQDARPDRSFLNNSRRIVWMVENYGDFNFDYFINGEVVFVARDQTLITVIHRDDDGMQRLFGSKEQPRFRKKGT